MRAFGVAIAALTIGLSSGSLASAQTAQSDFQGPFFGPKPSGAADAIEGYICFLIGAGTKTVDIANYTWSSQPIINALITAHQNGILVRVVADASETTSLPYTSQLTTAGISVVRRPVDPTGCIMHCKYIVVDQTYTWLGSANMTTGSSEDNYENGCCLGSALVAQNFESDFNQMFTQQLWSISKVTPTPNPTVTLTGVAGTPVQCDFYFSGEDSVQDQEFQELATLVNNATKSVQIMAYELAWKASTSTTTMVQAYGAAILAAQKRGVIVQLLCDNSTTDQANMNAPIVAAVNAAGGTGCAFSWHPTSGLLHDKVTIIDGSIVEFGSFNYTDQAEDSQGDGNDEEFVVVHDPALATIYQQEFQTIFQVSGAPGTAYIGSTNATAPTTTTPTTTTPTTTTPTTVTPTTTTTTTTPTTVTPTTVTPTTVTPTTTSSTTPVSVTPTTPVLVPSSTSPGSTSSAAAAGTSPTAASTKSSGGGCALVAGNGSHPTSLMPFALLAGLLVVVRRRRAA